MKKIIVPILLIWLCMGVADARVVWWNKEKAPSKIGVVLGLGVSYCGPGDDGFGVIGGGVYEKPIVKSFRIRTGFQLANYNSTYTEYGYLMGNRIERKDQFTVGALQLPVEAVYSLYFTPKVRFNLGAGFYGGVAIWGSLSTKTEGGSGITGGGDLKIWDVMNRGDFGYIINPSVTIKDKFDIGIEVRNSIIDTSKSGDGDWMNGLITVAFTYFF